MAEVLEKPREEISSLAPRIFSFKVPQDKIGAIIGPSGKIIKELVTDKLFSKGKHEMVIDKNENNLGSSDSSFSNSSGNPIHSGIFGGFLYWQCF